MRRTPSTRVPPSKPPIRSTPQRTMQAPWDRSHRIPCSSAKPKQKRQAPPTSHPSHPLQPPSPPHTSRSGSLGHSKKQKNSNYLSLRPPTPSPPKKRSERMQRESKRGRHPGFSLLSPPLSLRAVPPRPRRQPPPRLIIVRGMWGEEIPGRP